MLSSSRIGESVRLRVDEDYCSKEEEEAIEASTSITARRAFLFDDDVAIIDHNNRVFAHVAPRNQRRSVLQVTKKLDDEEEEGITRKQQE